MLLRLGHVAEILDEVVVIWSERMGDLRSATNGGDDFDLVTDRTRG